MLSKEYKKQIDIDAPASIVWEILTNVKEYKNWNNSLLIEGKLETNNKIKIELRAESKKPLKFAPIIKEIEIGKLIRWKGTLFMPGIFDGMHSLIIEPISSTKSRFIQHEIFTGILVPLVNLKPYIDEGWVSMNRNVKERSESLLINKK